MVRPRYVCQDGGPERLTSHGASGLSLVYVLDERGAGLIAFMFLALFLSVLGGRRFRTESDLSRNRAQLTATLEAVQDGIAVFDMRGRLLFANAAEARLNKYPDAKTM